MSNVLIINSSFRGKSNSKALGEQIAAGAQSKGHHVETLHIGKMRIEPCRGCYSCLKPGSDFCIIKDDMHPLYPSIVQADAILFVFPIYWFNMCGQTKQFLDRCFAVAADPNPDAPGRFSRKKIGAAFVYGDKDPLASGGVNAVRSLQDIAMYTKAQWVGAVYGTANDEGEMAAQTELLNEARSLGESL